MTTLAENLERARRTAGMSQTELAEKSGVYRKTISKIELGQSQGSGKTLFRLAAALGITMEDLVPQPSDTRESQETYLEVLFDAISEADPGFEYDLKRVGNPRDLTVSELVALSQAMRSVLSIISEKKAGIK